MEDTRDSFKGSWMCMAFGFENFEEVATEKRNTFGNTIYRYTLKN